MRLPPAFSRYFYFFFFNQFLFLQCAAAGIAAQRHACVAPAANRARRGNGASVMRRTCFPFFLLLHHFLFEIDEIRCSVVLSLLSLSSFSLLLYSGRRCRCFAMLRVIWLFLLSFFLPSEPPPSRNFKYMPFFDLCREERLSSLSCKGTFTDSFLLPSSFFLSSQPI